MATYPDVAAYHCIAVTLGQAGHMKELFDVIDTMRSPPKKKFKTEFLEKWDPRLEPDVIVYNAVSGIEELCIFLSSVIVLIVFTGGCCLFLYSISTQSICCIAS